MQQELQVRTPCNRSYKKCGPHAAGATSEDHVLQELNWRTLESHRETAWLNMLYNPDRMADHAV